MSVNFYPCKYLIFALSLFISKSLFSQSKNNDIYSKDPKSIAKGKSLFEANCGACHNFNQKGIGPNLSQVISEVEKPWIISVIKNSQALISKGDKRSKALFSEYKQIMPSFSWIQTADLESITAYINSEQKAINPKKALSKDAIKDPIVEKIKKSGKILQLEYLMTAPPTSDKIPFARINDMVVLKGEKPVVFLSDLRGIIYKFDEKTLVPYLDFKKEKPDFIHSPGLATGLGSYAFHPNFYQNGLFYTSHTEKVGTQKADFAYSDSIKVSLQWVLTEWKLKDPNADYFSGEPREILRINMVSQIHGMQQIGFNSNAKKGSEDYGLLYVGIGDGGASENGFPFICDDLSNIWSSVIRIDPTGGNSKNGKYGIPKNNPFAMDNNPKTAGEVFCRGFRNPNRFSWTPDGKMLISDIGHANIEELNLGIAGNDYGWPYREGNFVIKPEGNMNQLFPKPTKEKKYTYPIAQYDHEEGNAISAGFLYTSSDIPFLSDKYIFGDIVNGRVFFIENKDLVLGKPANIQELDLELDGKPINFREICNNSKTDLRFGQGESGELYLYTKTDGKIYKVINCK